MGDRGGWDGGTRGPGGSVEAVPPVNAKSGRAGNVKASPVCLATVTTEAFLPGTLATIGSFLRRHPRFGGDIVVVHDALPEGALAAVAALSERVRFEPVGPELRDRLVRLEYVYPEFLPLRARFYALEAFRLTGYRKVLSCDSDLLFRQSVGELFERPETLLCCGDRVFIEGSRSEAAERTFNCGFLMIDAHLLGGGPYADLLALVSPETWRDADRTRTDHVPLNRYFAGRATLIDQTYNYVLLFAKTIRERDGLAWPDAKVLHFNGAVKPWQIDAMPRWMTEPLTPSRPPAAALPAFKLWYDAYLDSLAAARARFVARSAAAVRGPAKGAGATDA